jgi:Protein of unknown function (DUF2505)
VVKVEYAADYGAGVPFARQALTDKAFLDAYATEIGALSWDATTDGSRTKLAMTVPTNGVPTAFKRFVTPTVEIVEARSWNAVGERCSGTVSVDAAVGKREARIRGTISLIPVAGGCRFRFAGDIAVNLRVVGDAAALLIRDLIRRVLAQQTKVMLRWISGIPPAGE